jgi:glycogen debranching enzyme
MSGIVDGDKAEAVSRRLMSPEMFSGWGIRTLASSMGAYDPMSYTTDRFGHTTTSSSPAA